MSVSPTSTVRRSSGRGIVENNFIGEGQMTTALKCICLASAIATAALPAAATPTIVHPASGKLAIILAQNLPPQLQNFYGQVLQQLQQQYRQQSQQQNQQQYQQQAPQYAPPTPQYPQAGQQSTQLPWQQSQQYPQNAPQPSQGLTEDQARMLLMQRSMQFGGIFRPAMDDWMRSPSGGSGGQDQCAQQYSDYGAQQACRAGDGWAADRLQNKQESGSEHDWYNR
jgi:hypothetical protein